MPERMEDNMDAPVGGPQDMDEAMKKPMDGEMDESIEQEMKEPVSGDMDDSTENGDERTHGRRHGRLDEDALGTPRIRRLTVTRHACPARLNELICRAGRHLLRTHPVYCYGSR